MERRAAYGGGLGAAGVGRRLQRPALAGGICSGRRLNNRLPPDYRYVYGQDRPFAPSRARTATGRAIDPQSLAGAMTCGTAGCQEQIRDERLPSAHR